MDRLSGSVRAGLERFRLGKSEAWGSLAEIIQPTAANGYASLHSTAYEYFSTAEQAPARNNILELVGRQYRNHCDNLPQKQKSGLAQAGKNWNVTIWHFYLALGPDILRSRESCLALVRMSKCATLDFDTCVTQIHAQRQQRLQNISRSTSLDTAGKVKPADVSAVEKLYEESTPGVSFKTRIESTGSMPKAARIEGWKSRNRKKNAKDPESRGKEAAAPKEVDHTDLEDLEDAAQDEYLEGDTLIDTNSEKGRRYSRRSSLVIPSTPDLEGGRATGDGSIEGTTATRSQSVRKRPLSICDRTESPCAKRTRSNDEDGTNLINLTVPLEQLVLGVGSLDDDRWANDTAVCNTIRKLRGRDCYVLDSLSLAGGGFLRQAPTERYFVAPVNIRNTHWALYFWDTESTTIEYYDSSYDLRKRTNPYCKDRLLSIINSAFKPARMPEIKVCNAFQQKNSTDCGPLTILNVFQKRLGLGVDDFIQRDEFDSTSARTYFQHLLLTSLDAAPPGFAKNAGFSTPREISRDIFNKMRTIKLQGHLRNLVRKDFLLQANLSVRASKLVHLHERHCTLVRQAYEESLQARDVRNHELKRLESLREYVFSLPTDTPDHTSSVMSHGAFGQGLGNLEQLAREALVRMLPAAEKIATQSGPLTWPEDRPITTSILMLRHLGREYVKAERVLCDFREGLEALA